MTPGQELRAARTAQGLTLPQVAERTRIPTRYLQALEDDDASMFPTGPFHVGFSKKYRTLLGLPDRAPLPAGRPSAEGGRTRGAEEEPEPTATVTAPAQPSSATRRRALQMALLGGLLVSAGLLTFRALGEATPELTEPIGEPMDLAVQVDVEEAVRVRAYADGERKFSDALKPGPGMMFLGRDTLKVELETLAGVELTFQGKPLRPLGHQSRPRRLVFIDDGH